MKENLVRHVRWMYIYTAYSIGSKANAYRKSIVVARYIWKQMNVAEKTITVVSTTKNYHCSQAVIGQLCIVSYSWLANSIMSTIIYVTFRTCIIILSMSGLGNNEVLSFFNVNFFHTQLYVCCCNLAYEVFTYFLIESLITTKTPIWSFRSYVGILWFWSHIVIVQRVENLYYHDNGINCYDEALCW